MDGGIGILILGHIGLNLWCCSSPRGPPLAELRFCHLQLAGGLGGTWGTGLGGVPKALGGVLLRTVTQGCSGVGCLRVAGTNVWHERM